MLTANDLARQFGAMARPLSLLGEAELRLRNQVQRKLPQQFAERTPQWGHAPTFGAYKSILADPATFAELGWPLDHTRFLDLLTVVVGLRNELMHISDEPLTREDLKAVESFVTMLMVMGQAG